MAADTILDSLGKPRVPLKVHDNGDGTYSVVVTLSDDTIAALAAAIAAAIAP